MVTIGLKKVSTDSQTDFNVFLVPDYITEDIKDTYLDFERFREVLAKYRVWEITFGILNETQMDFLADYSTKEEPQFIYDSNTYNVEILEFKNGYKGATMKIIEREPVS